MKMENEHGIEAAEDNNFVEALVCCHGVGCENQEVRIKLLVRPEHTYVVCGPCGNEITDVVFM